MQFINVDFVDYLSGKSVPSGFTDNELFVNAACVRNILLEFGADKDVEVLGYDKIEKGRLGFFIFDKNRDLSSQAPQETALPKKVPFSNYPESSNSKEYDLELKVFPEISSMETCHSVEEWSLPFEEARNNKWLIISNDSPRDLRLGYVVWNSDGLVGYSIRLKVFKATLKDYMKSGDQDE